MAFFEKKGKILFFVFSFILCLLITTFSFSESLEDPLSLAKKQLYDYIGQDEVQTLGYVMSVSYGSSITTFKVLQDKEIFYFTVLLQQTSLAKDKYKVMLTQKWNSQPIIQERQILNTNFEEFDETYTELYKQWVIVSHSSHGKILEISPDTETIYKKIAEKQAK